ncbi:MAG: Ig-like domain-containing protein [SAR202 cluster bacterium]|nr:Ig-like domain-containing protein [SAR202 cluster bacterium]
MNTIRRVLLSVLTTAVLIVATSNSAHGAGPGLGNKTYNPDELFKPASIIKSPSGHGAVTMVDGYLMVIYASDGGTDPENQGIEFWDVSDPRNPFVVVSYKNADTVGLREAHSIGRSNSYPKDYIVTLAQKGIQFWDVTDPFQLSMVSYMALSEVEFIDYAGTFWLFWQAPYVYVAGTGRGLYVVDATDPANPTLVNRVRSDEIGFGPSSVLAIGNLLLVGEPRNGRYATMDLSDPANPVMIQLLNGKRGYGHTLAAGKILVSGGNGDANKVYIYDLDHDGAMSYYGELGDSTVFSNGGYGSYQDGFFHSGFSQRYAKFDIETMTQIGVGTSGLEQRDEDFALVLGNLVFVGDDHGVGSALIVHQAAADTKGPEVTWVHPKNNASNMALTTRVGVSMSDTVDVGSLGPSTFAVRPLSGAALPGKYSVVDGLVNFAPDLPLFPNTTYEVVIDGIADVVGNSSGTFTSRFSTGDPESLPRCVLKHSPPAEANASVAYAVDSSSGKQPITYSWYFGDGDTPTPPALDPAAEHSYSKPTGIYSEPMFRYRVTLKVQNEFGRGSCSLIQIIHNPLTATRAVSSSDIIHDGTQTFNVNPDNDTVTAINQSGLTKAWEAPVGDNPRTLAESPAGAIWIVNQDDATISILDKNDGGLTNELTLPVASRPYGIAFSPDGSGAYVTLQGTGRLLKLATSGAIVGDIDMGPQPRGIAVSGDSSRILVTRYISEADHGEVHEVDGATFTLKRTFELKVDPGPDREFSGRGVPNYLNQVRITPDGRRAYVASKKDNVLRGLFRDGLPLTYESLVRTIVSQIDLQSNTGKYIAAGVDLNDRDMAQSVIFSPVGDLFFIATQGTNKVEIYDAANVRFVGTMNTGLAPQGMVFNGDGSKLYVHNYMSRTVSVFDTTSFVDGTGNSASLLAEVSTVANEALMEQVLRGKRIFYNASDRRMNLDSYVSCASCHNEGESDEQVWDFTQGGEGLHNTVSLRGRAGMGHGYLHWSANFDEV